EVRQALDTAMAHKVASSMRGTHNPDLHDLVGQMVELASRGEIFPAQDRAFHTSLLSRIDNALVGQLVGAFWDVHTAVMPRLGVTLPADIITTAEAHGDMLRAAESGDAEALIVSVEEHYAPILRALEGARPRPSDTGSPASHRPRSPSAGPGRSPSSTSVPPARSPACGSAGWPAPTSRAPRRSPASSAPGPRRTSTPPSPTRPSPPSTSSTRRPGTLRGPSSPATPASTSTSTSPRRSPSPSSTP